MHAAKDKKGDRKKNTLPRTSRHGKNTGMPRHRRCGQRNNTSCSSSSSSGRWPGGGHGVGAIKSSAYSRAT
jgi:hypothetical protein